MKRLILSSLKYAVIAMISFMIASTYLSIDVIKNLQIYSIRLVDQVNELQVERNSRLETSINQKIEEQKEVKPSYEYLKSMTVRIINFTDNKLNQGSIGTGSIIKVTDDFTYILTNKHVAPIDDSKFLFVEKDSKRYRARVLKNGIYRDLSLIQIVGKIPDTNVVKGFAKTKEQDKIYSVGMYFGEYDIYSEGTVAGWKGDSRLMNIPCLNGCSGSGVFNDKGEMVAVVFAGTAYNIFGFDTAKAICVPYIGIMAFLEEIL